MSSLAIGARSAGLLAAPKGELLPDSLDAIFLQELGRQWRKIGRFIKLAMIGAARAAHRFGPEPLPPGRTGVFLGTGLGNLPELLAFSESVFSEGELFPSPIQFANSLGNSGAFYIAQAFGLTGPVLAISQEEASFEGAVLNAEAMLVSGDIDLALVGGVDVFQPTAVDHLGRMGYPAGASLTMGEGSGWLLLERLSPRSIAQVELVEVGHAEDPAALLAAARGKVALNARLAPRAAELLPAGARRFDPGFGAFMTESAAIACAFIEDESCRGETLDSLSGTRDGCIGRLRLRRLDGRGEHLG